MYSHKECMLLAWPRKPDHGAAPALLLSGYWTQCVLTKVAKTICVQEPDNLSIY